MRNKIIEASLIGFAFFLEGMSESTFAQIVPDRSLPTNSKVEIDGDTSIVTKGTRNGNNLFHSFERLSIPSGTALKFKATEGLNNIIGRVSGKNISRIDGRLESTGTVNLILLNRNGIIFGPNAALNIGGSFLATTGYGNDSCKKVPRCP